MIKNIQAKDIMTKEVISVRPETKIKEAADLLSRYNLTGLPVIDKENKVIGIISEADFMIENNHFHLPSFIQILQSFHLWQSPDEKLKEEIKKASKIKASEMMNSKVITVFPETSLKDLASLFAKKRINPIPVVDKENHLLGIVSRADIVRLFTLPPFQKTTGVNPWMSG